MASYLYRINGGQVLVAAADIAWIASMFDATYYRTVTDPPTPDGGSLSPPKIYDGTRVRNATTQEQSAFLAASATDTTQQERARASAYLQVDPVFRKVLSALVDVLVQQINVLRTQPSTTFTAITKAQAKTAIINAINDGSND
jgi:hypothetical protein